MTEVGKVFKETLGKPNPKTETALIFKNLAYSYIWKELSKELGAGWFLNKYIYLFGPAIKKLNRAIEAWDFLMPDDTKDRMVIGFTAFGSILIVENGNSKKVDKPIRVGLLDPFLIRYFRNPNLDFIGLMGYWFPHRELSNVFDGKVENFYQQFFSKNNDRKSDFQIFGILKAPVFGGELSVSNFQLMDIVKYFEYVTAPPYKKAYSAYLKQSGNKKGSY